MSTLVARPVAVDLKSILKTESSPPSLAAPRQQRERRSTDATPSQHTRGPSHDDFAHPPVYTAYPAPVQLGQPLRPHPPYPPPITGGFAPNYPSGILSGGPVHVHGQWVEPSQITPLKRPPSPGLHPNESAPKKQSKWTDDEDNQLISLRGEGMKWEEIARHVPGRSAIACRLHYQNFLERRAAWDEEKKNKLAQLYNRLKGEIWDKIARELHMPWRAVEEMHWRMGRTELAQRAGVREFVATPDAAVGPGGGIPITTSFIPSTSYQQPPQPNIFTASPHMLPLPGSSLQPNYAASPLPPPPSVLSAPPQPTVHPTTQFIDPTRPPPAFVSGPRSPVHRSRRSASSNASSRHKFEQQSQRHGSDHGSPRQNAGNGTRIASSSAIPDEGRQNPTPPPPLPPLSKDLAIPISDVNQGPTLPPVRLLQEEVRESSRYTTPNHLAPGHTGSGPSRSHSTASGSRSTGEYRGETGSVTSQRL